MSKAHRGGPLRKEGVVRGRCPITGLTGVKLLYEHENEKGEKIKISKAGHAKFKNIRKAEERTSKAAVAAQQASTKTKEKPADTTDTAPPQAETVDTTNTTEIQTDTRAEQAEETPEIKEES